MSPPVSYEAWRKEALEKLAQYQKRGAISANVGTMADMLMDESDRGVVMILGSLLEDILLEQITAKFVKLPPKKLKNLTRAGGLLSNFDDRIYLAEALGIIDDDMVDSLQILKAMRNACAHSRHHIDFQTFELKATLVMLFDSESAEAIMGSSTPMFLRICFIAQFVVLSEMLRGTADDVAQAMGQALLDRILEEAKLIDEKRQKRRAASQKRRTKPPAKRPRKPPKD